MNNDLISREALRKAFHGRIYYFDKSSWDEANALIDNAPAVEPEKGEWEQISPSKIYECKRCHKTVMTSDIEEYHYCHGCGAKMKGGAE